MVDKELKKKRTTLEKEKALLDEFEPPLANQLKTKQTEKLNVLVAPEDEILSIITEKQIEDEIKEMEASENLFIKYNGN